MLEKYRYNVYRCTRCGVCRAKYNENVHYVCPVVENTAGFDHYCGRGRIATAKGILEEKFSYSDALIDVIYACLCCENCREQCGSVDPETDKPLIDTARIVRAMREEIVELGKAPKVMSELAKVVAETKNTFGGSLEKKKALAQKYNLPGAGKVLFFSGCYSVFRNPKEAEDTIKILKSAEVDLAYLADSEWCCGVMQYWDGNTSVMRDMVYHNIEMIEKSGADKIVTACSGCYDTIKDIYPEIIEDNLPFNVLHLSEYLADLLDQGKLKFKNELNKTVTYHDPCHLGRHAGIYEQPRKVIASIPGIKLVEMERNRSSAFCCGSGIGSVRATHPKMALQITHSRVDEAMATGAEVVTSACPMCVEQLELSGKKRKMNLEFINLPELVARAMGL
jgi:heterodisulfide reductase subunit D